MNNLAVVYLCQARLRAGRAALRARRDDASGHAGIPPSGHEPRACQPGHLLRPDRSFADALRLQTEATEVGEHNLALVLASGSEAQKLRYMETFAEGTDITVSLHRRSAPDDEGATRLALTTVLRRKGRVLDAMSSSLQAVRERLTPEGKAALDELAGVRGELARLVLRGPGRTPLAEFEQAVASARDREQQLEAIAESAEPRVSAQALAVTIAAVQAALPADAVLVEFIAYRPFDPLAVKRDARFGPARYVAFVLGANRRASVDRHRRCRDDRRRWSIGCAARCAIPRTASVTRIARELDATVMAPVRARLASHTKVFLSLQTRRSTSCRLPRWSMSSNAISSSASRSPTSRAAATSFSCRWRRQRAMQPLVVANPQFDRPGEAGAATGGDARAADLSRARFVPLPGTAGEAAAIGPLLPGATVLTGLAGDRARGQEPCTVPASCTSPPTGSSSMPRPSGGEGWRLLVMDAAPSDAPSVALENPLLRSGLAFAGANKRDGGDGEDGILTALEATALDLWGTRLAVLSACETGVGEARRGDGVYGLRRALVMAGAESQLMTLWQVSDLATRDLMTSYYRQLQAGAGRAEGLRAVQRDMLATARTPTPVLLGELHPVGCAWADELAAATQSPPRARAGQLGPCQAAAASRARGQRGSSVLNADLRDRDPAPSDEMPSDIPSRIVTQARCPVRLAQPFRTSSCVALRGRIKSSVRRAVSSAGASETGNLWPRHRG